MNKHECVVYCKYKANIHSTLPVILNPCSPVNLSPLHRLFLIPLSNYYPAFYENHLHGFLKLYFNQFGI